MDSGSIAAIIVAVIALVSAYASQRSASKASTHNVQIETRVDMERDAYLRARKLDTESIARLDIENEELRKQRDLDKREIENLKEKVRNLESEVARFKLAFVRQHIPLPSDKETKEAEDDGNGPKASEPQSDA